MSRLVTRPFRFQVFLNDVGASTQPKTFGSFSLAGDAGTQGIGRSPKQVAGFDAGDSQHTRMTLIALVLACLAAAAIPGEFYVASLALDIEPTTTQRGKSPSLSATSPEAVV